MSRNLSDWAHRVRRCILIHKYKILKCTGELAFGFSCAKCRPYPNYVQIVTFLKIPVCFVVTDVSKDLSSFTVEVWQFFLRYLTQWHWIT